jgi:chitinase
MSIPTSTTSLQTQSPNSYLNNMQSVVSTYTFVSDVCPIIHTVNSLVMTCNLINSKYNNEKSNTFFSIPMSASFGSLITIGPFPPCLCNIYGGYYQNIELQFYDTYGSPVNVRDSDITISLVLSTENDVPPHIQRFM